jgi:diguanylate cyclase (GGDEF)-like protein/PAS domain S-box-containing protein
MDHDADDISSGAPALSGAFVSYPGPVLRLEEDASVTPLNEAAREVEACLSGDGGIALMPALVQLAVKARSEGRAKARTFTLPGSGRQVEFIMLPQLDGTQLMIGRDATLEVNIRSALAESRTRFKDLVDIAADFAWETDPAGMFCYISPRGALDHAPEELLGHDPASLLLSPETAPSPSPFEAEQTVRNVEIWLRTRAGEPACLLVSAVPVPGPDGKPAGARGIAIDVTEERRRQSELAGMKIRERQVGYIVNALRSEVSQPEMLRAAATAFGRACSAACTVRVRGTEEMPLAMAAHGRTPPPALADHVMESLSPGATFTDAKVDGYRFLGITTRYRGAANGAIVLWRSLDEPAWDDDERALIRAVEPQFGIVFRQMLDQYTLEQLSRTDDLTGLRNRRAFIEDVSRELERERRTGGEAALLFIDLDNFKPINDLHGHERGDETLRAIATILDGATRRYDLVCRLGGDEFAIWLDGASREIAEGRAEDLLSRVDTWKVGFLGEETSLGMSIGIAMLDPTVPETAENLIARADAAMYEAKNAGKNRLRFADPVKS